MNPVQIRGSSDRALIAGVTWLLTYLSTKGYITTSQAADFGPLILAVGGAIYGWWVNRDARVAAQAASLPGTTVVTTPEIAAATPNNPNVISSSESNASINASVKENK